VEHTQTVGQVTTRPTPRQSSSAGPVFGNVIRARRYRRRGTASSAPYVLRRVLFKSRQRRRFQWTVLAIGIGVAAFLTAVATTEAKRGHLPVKSARSCGWRTVRSADPHPALYDRFNSVAAVSPSEAWAVGDYFTGREGGRHGAFIEHWDGRRWLLAHAAIPPGATLESVSASGAGDAWAVGNRRNLGQLIQHWDGARWRVLPAPRPGGILHAVAERTPRDAWAVGARKRDPGFGTLIEHWNGRRWTVVASPSPPVARGQRRDAILQAVTVISPTDVWAAGETVIGVPATASRTLIEHWNGERWMIVPSSNVTSRGVTNDFLFSVSGRRDDVWAVGSWGNYLAGGFGGRGDHALALHWDGRRWSRSATPALGHRSLLSGVAAAVGRAWAVGDRGLQPHQHTLIERFDGKRWSIVPSAPGFSLTAVSARSGGGAWAVGANGRRPLAARC
jgi:hypothetical protein